MVRPIVGFTIVPALLAIGGCEAGPAFVSPAAAALEAASWDALQQARRTSDADVYDAMDEPWRPGQSLFGTWNVPTPESDAILTRLRDTSDLDPRDGLHEKYERMAPLLRVHPWQIELKREGERVVREYDVLRETPDEVEIQLRGGAAERAVLSLRGDEEIHAPDLAAWVGGARWKRCHHPCWRGR